MTPDIEQIRARAEAAQAYIDGGEHDIFMTFDKLCELADDISALLAVIDEMTAENEALKRMYEGNFIMGRVAERKAWLDEIT